MPDHPYRHAEDRAFWSRSVASGFRPETVADPAPFRLTGEDRFMSAGSCFAANVRRYLDAWGFTYVVAEPPHPQWPETAESAYYEAYSARYGNVYTARQMVQLLQRAVGEFCPREDHWIDADLRFVDPFRPGLEHRAWSLPELHALTEQHLRAVRRAVETATVFVFTLGLTEAWTSVLDGAVFPACPGTIAGEFRPDRHRHVNFSGAEVSADLDQMVTMLRGLNPQLRIVITVSPVPLVATASGRHVLAATTYSKSVLRVAADEVVHRHRDVAYFPAFELVLGPQHRQSPFGDDLRTVREPVVAEVMNAFRSAFIDGGDPAPRHDRSEKTCAVDAVVEAAIADECEEMFADEKLWDGHRPQPPRPPLDMRTLRLAVGAHEPGSGEFCVMEAAAYVAGEAWSDRPPSVSPAITELLLTLNDVMDDDERQRLREMITKLPQSRGDAELETARSWMVMDWHCRTWTSTWLRVAGCAEEAEALAAARSLEDPESLGSVLPALEDARRAAAKMNAAATRESLEQSLDVAITSAGAHPSGAGIAAARTAIRSGAAGPAIRAAQQQVPIAERWNASRSARWQAACDAVTYATAVAAATAQVAAVRALTATSAWNSGWDTAAEAERDTWVAAREHARSAGRDAAMAVAWRSAWQAAISHDPSAIWQAAAAAATLATQPPTRELGASIVELLDSLVIATGRVRAYATG